jgi:hypothetical protein
VTVEVFDAYLLVPSTLHNAGDSHRVVAITLVDLLAEPMRMWPISTRVNKPENDNSSILEPIELSAA